MKTPFLFPLLILSLLFNVDFCYGQDVNKEPNSVDEFTSQVAAGTKERYRDYDPDAPDYILPAAILEQQAQIDALKNELTQVALYKQGMVQIKQSLLNPNLNTAIPSAYLGRNIPNPIIQETTIPFYVPEEATSAQIRFYTNTGQEVYSVTLTERGQGGINISSGQFASGTYVYRLIIDGKNMFSKKLVIIK